VSRRAPLLAAVAAAAAAALAACGTPSPDLMVITRSGADPAANVTMLVNDGGSVTCNGKKYEMTDPEILDARQLVRDLADQATLGIQLPPGPGSTLRYRVRMEKGTIAFSDRSAGIPLTFQRVAKFTKDVSEGACHIAR
jgi:hypothetical protein